MSVQRIFLLQISRGFKTISTDALCVMTGIPPINISLLYEYNKTRLLQLDCAQTKQEMFPHTDIQFPSNSWQIHPYRETSHFQVSAELGSSVRGSGLGIFTDGSGTASGVAAAFCVLDGSLPIHRWSTKLQDFNSVYQAELFAILNALDWLLKNPQPSVTPLYSDCYSGLQAIKRHRNRHPLILQIKLKLQQLLYKTHLYHVSAHTGVQGNELADELAKETTKSLVIDSSLPAPPSHIKKLLKIKVLQDWQADWDASTKGRHTYRLIPKVSFKYFPLSPPVSAFLSGHGPFAAYLNYYRRSRTDRCACGERGDSEHYYYNCPETLEWHLLKPAIPPLNWLDNILSRPLLLKKLSKIYYFLSGVPYVPF